LGAAYISTALYTPHLVFNDHKLREDYIQNSGQYIVQAVEQNAKMHSYGH